MTVEKIEKYKGETYMVVIDRVKKVFLHRDIINRFGLAEGSEITNEQLTQVLMASELRRASRRAMYLINERDYSYIQLFEKLSANYSEDICYKVTDMMAKKGFINDRRYAQEVVYTYMECRLYGPRRVKQELYKRGIRGRIADEVIRENLDGLYERLEKLIDRKYSEYLEDPEDFKAVNRAKNGLVRAGYDYDDINYAVKKYIEEREED